MSFKTEYFPGVEKILYEGADSRNPLAFRWYDENRLVAGKTMKEHFRFAVAYWHSFVGNGADPFGMPVRPMPWMAEEDPEKRAIHKMDAAFEFMQKLGTVWYCFHDTDLIEEGDTISLYEKRLSGMVDYARQKQQESGVRLLWGTANLFSHPRYMHGAATSPDYRVVARAAVQVKNAIDATIALGGQGYVFWGGREGYMSLLNTDMKREQEHLAMFLRMARDYGRSQGFTGTFFIEPKPMEPCKHQYDYDAATVLGFLRQYDLLDDFALNLEVNHATLAGHTMQHEMQVAADAGKLGSMDANRGDYQNGWDTDQFPVDLLELTQMMMILLESGGFTHGGINFDAKLRRNSTDLSDLFIAHITGMDAFARALVTAEEVLTTSGYCDMRAHRYRSFDSGDGRLFEEGRLSLMDLYHAAGMHAEPIPKESGKQERYEQLLNMYV